MTDLIVPAGRTPLNGGAYQNAHDLVPPGSQIVRYNAPPLALAGLPARRQALLREGHTLAVQVCGLFGGIPKVHTAAWWTDVLRKRFTIFGPALRFVDECLLRGVPHRVIRQVADWLADYIDQGCAERDATAHAHPEG